MSSTLYANPSRGAAFFDLDRTLISGASAFAFALAAWRADLYPGRRFARDALKAVAFRLSGASDEQVDLAREQMLNAVRGNRQADLMALNGDVIPRLLDKVRPEAKDLIDMHRHAGRDTYIVSASPQEIVEPLAQAIGMTGGLGTRAEVKDGIYTGELAGPFCYGAGKVEAIREIAEWEGYDLSLCYGYSDSASDLPMLQALGHPVAVNPDGPLERTARRRGWPVVVFRRRTKTVARRSAVSAAALALAGAAFAAGAQYGRHVQRAGIRTIGVGARR